MKFHKEINFLESRFELFNKAIFIRLQKNMVFILKEIQKLFFFVKQQFHWPSLPKSLMAEEIFSRFLIRGQNQNLEIYPETSEFCDRKIFSARALLTDQL